MSDYSWDITCLGSDYELAIKLGVKVIYLNVYPTRQIALAALDWRLSLIYGDTFDLTGESKA